MHGNPSHAARAHRPGLRDGGSGEGPADTHRHTGFSERRGGKLGGGGGKEPRGKWTQDSEEEKLSSAPRRPGPTLGGGWSPRTGEKHRLSNRTSSFRERTLAPSCPTAAQHRVRELTPPGWGLRADGRGPGPPTPAGAPSGAGPAGTSDACRSRAALHLPDWR